MKLSIKAGSTSQSVLLFIQDSSSTTGAGLTGLTYNSSGLTAYYSFAGASAGSTSITLATLSAVNSSWSSGGFKEVDGTNMPGIYRFDIPNAVLGSGNGRSVVVYLQGATNMAPLPIEIELTGWDNQDAVHGGMSALPNTACTTNASLLTSGTGTDQLKVSSGNVEVGTYASGQDPATLVLAGSVPTSNTANTVADCLNAARAQGFGKWVLSGTTLSLYAPDGTTVVRSFTLDNATAPSQRT